MKKNEMGFFPGLKGKLKLLLIFNLTVLLLTCCFMQVSANSVTLTQPQLTINGTITDNNGQPLPGVTIVILGTTHGTISNADGSYSISNVPEDATLEFSFVGMRTQKIQVADQTNIDVRMEEATLGLDEVVVTALGITKDRKSLGYATTQVTSDQLSINRTPNLMDALSGQLPGVNITSLGTGPGGSTKIRIRGQSSLSAHNDPLIVINGTPIDNTNFGANSEDSGIRSDGGDGLASINPDNIESMTILKGAAASAMYGSRAKDGVIMITTKKQGSGEGIGITYNVNYTTETPLDFTDWQYEYGQGEHGVRPTSPDPTSGQWSFGEKFQQGMTHILYDNIEVPYEPQKGRIKEFFRNAQNITNTVSLSSSSEKGGMNLSLSNSNNEGVVPNNSFKRNIVNFGFDYDLSDKLGFTGYINYSNEKNENPPNVGIQDNSIPVVLYNLANSFPLDVLEANSHDENGNEYVYSRFRNRTNPYWVLKEQFNTIIRDRTYGNVAITYNFTDWLYIQGRIGQDYWARAQEVNNLPTGKASLGPAPAGFVNGIYTQEVRRFREINNDFLLAGNKSFGNIGIDATIGGNQMRRRSDINRVRVNDFVIRDFYTVQNGRAKDPTYSISERAVNSLYGAAEISFKDYFYLTGTVRNDWFSTLSPGNRSILYPSVSASLLFTEIFDLPEWFSFGKIRAAYAEVGSDTDVPPYSNLLFYTINSQLATTVLGQSVPVGGISGSTVPNPDLRPMRTSENELGLELTLFDNRLSFDLSVYKRITVDQIVTAQISDASSFTNTRINSGENENKGFEGMVNIMPVRTNNFNWNIRAVGSYNISKVLSLESDTPGERITVGTHDFNGELRQIVGEEMAQITGFGFKRDENGNRIFDSRGVPIRTDEMITFGSALPKWTGSITNTFNYNDFRFSFLIDFKLGNKMLSGTNFNAVRHGLHKMTLEGRENGVIGEGVDINGNVNQVAAPVQTYWEVVRSHGLVEPIIYNGGYWKLRQITLGYDFSRYFNSSSFIKGLALNLTANNVLILKKWIDNIDPESFGYGSDNIVGMESTGVPTTRSIGFNFNVKF